MDLPALTPGYRALREQSAWIDLRERGKILATGEDRARLLHALSTNHIEQLKPGQGCYAFFLNAQGRILADANILCFDNALLLDTEPETRVKLFEHLDRYIIADDVAIEDRTAALSTIAIEGPESAAVLRKLGAPVPDEPYSSVRWADRVIARISSTGSEGFFVFSEVATGSPLADAQGSDAHPNRVFPIPPATAEDARTVRIENGRPRYGEEITERNLVQETGQIHAVHPNKGCYLGQEIVERVRSQARLHRMLRRLEIDAVNPPAPGTKTAEVEIMSSAFSPALQKSVALAYVRTEFGPGSELSIDGARATVSAAWAAPHPRET